MIRTVLLLVVLSSATASAQFAWQEIEIPVRDGARLAADLYTTGTSVPKPVVLVQTPYNKNFYRIGTGLPPQAGGFLPLDTASFNYVIVDWRGFFGSRDDAQPGYDRGLDGYDVVEWIAAQGWCNGKVGTWGPSALGAIQFLTARHHPPHLVCAVPMVKDFKTKYEDYYYGGEYRKSHVEALESLGFLTTDFILSHPTKDLVMRGAEVATDYPDEFAVPMLVIGGWFDHFPDDVLRAFRDIARRSDPSVRDEHRLLFGPWTHSGIDRSTQGELEYPNAVGAANDAALLFFRYHLLDEENGWNETPVVRYYQLGADEWRETGDWYELVGQADTTALFLRGEGTLAFNGMGGPSHQPDSVVYDPADPSPTHGGSFFDPFDRDAPVGPYDQRAVVESRGDAAIYTTGVLDRDIDVNGPIAVKLFVSSDREDTDVAVRLCDVYPDGRSMLLTQGIRRLRFRNGFRPEDTSLVVPGEVYEVTVELQHLAITFRKDHRIRIIVTGSNHPHFEANPNTAAPLYDSPDSVVAVNRIHLAPDSPSRILLPTSGTSGVAVDDLSAEAIPESRSLEIVPNPAAAGATVRFRLADAARVRLELHDLHGRAFAALYEATLEDGDHILPVLFPEDLPSGVYLCRLTLDGKRNLEQTVVVH